MFWCRKLLQLTVIIWAGFGLAALIVGLAQVPGLALLGIGILIFYGVGRRYIPSGVFGTARKADIEDAAKAGYVGADDGVLVSQTKIPFLLAARSLFSKAVDHSTACKQFFAALKREKIAIRINRGVNTLVIAPTGAGKGVSLAIPFLKTDPNSAVVNDPKGELFKRTAWDRHRMGQRVVCLDPHKLVGGNDTFNPLSSIDSTSLDALDRIRALAEAIIVRTGEEKEPHWNDGAEMFLVAIIAWVLVAAKPEAQTMQTVSHILSNPAELATAIKMMQSSDAYGGMLARLGAQLEHFVDREKGSVLTTVNRHLRFANTPLIAENMKATSFDLRQLRTGRVTIYLVISNEHLRALSGLLRLWIVSLQQAIIGGGAHESGKVTFVLDECAALGRMPAIIDGITQLRGYGLRHHLYFQSLGQIKEHYPEGQDQTILSNCDTQIFFGVNDLSTAEYVSKRIGTATVQNWSENGGTSTSTSTDGHGCETSSRSSNTGYSVSEVGREVMKPEEVMAQDQRAAIVFAPHIPPLHCWLTRYYETRTFKAAMKRLTGVKRFLMTFRAFGLAASSIALACTLLYAVDKAQRQSAPPPPPRLATPR